jgi:hypothetical protein
MSELKSVLEQRLAAKEEPVYKEFDRSTGVFKEITKEERDRKQRELELNLQEKINTESYFESAPRLDLSDLLAELKQKQVAECEIFE